MWELLHTEVSYIRRLRVITNVSVDPGPCCFPTRRGQLSVPSAKLGLCLTVVGGRLQAASGARSPAGAWEGCQACWPGEADLT